VLDGADVPVLQVVIATTKRAAWRDSARGLGAADLAMHVVLPELDGRVLAGAVAFKITAAQPSSPSPRSRTARSRTGSPWWRIASRSSHVSRCCRAASGASRS